MGAAHAGAAQHIPFPCVAIHAFQQYDRLLLLRLPSLPAGVELPRDMPAVHAWVERLLARPAVRCAGLQRHTAGCTC